MHIRACIKHAYTAASSPLILREYRVSRPVNISSPCIGTHCCAQLKKCDTYGTVSEANVDDPVDIDVRQRLFVDDDWIRSNL